MNDNPATRRPAGTWCSTPAATSWSRTPAGKCRSGRWKSGSTSARWPRHAGQPPIAVARAVPDPRVRSNRFGAVLFIEKEGFLPLFHRVRLAERYDLAIMSTKGMRVVAARHAGGRVCGAAACRSGAARLRQGGLFHPGHARGQTTAATTSRHSRATISTWACAWRTFRGLQYEDSLHQGRHAEAPGQPPAQWRDPGRDRLPDRQGRPGRTERRSTPGRS